MATGRTVFKHCRAYIGGYDLSGYTRSVGPLVWEYDALDGTADMGDAVRGYLPGQPSITPSTLNVVFDNTATVGSHILLKSPGVSRVCMFPFGMRAAPAQGDPVFCGRWQQNSYQASAEGVVTATINFGGWDAAQIIPYSIPWGDLLHANSEVTAVNAAAGIDNPTGDHTDFGGYMVYQVFAASGGAITGVIKVQDAAVNNDGGFVDVAGLTTGVLDFTLPQAGIVSVANTATIRQFTRWQLVFTTMTNITFALTFVRNYHPI